MFKVNMVGPTVVHFEDLAEGQSFPTVVKGPMMVGHQVRWAGACDNYDSEFHHDEAVAKAAGLPGAILSGPFMASLLLTAVTQWLGREARLVRFFDQNRGSTLPHDMAYLNGKVKRKFEKDGKAFVELDCWIANQRDEITTPGTALAEIGRRAA